MWLIFRDNFTNAWILCFLVEVETFSIDDTSFPVINVTYCDVNDTRWNNEFWLWWFNIYQRWFWRQFWWHSIAKIGGINLSEGLVPGRSLSLVINTQLWHAKRHSFTSQIDPWIFHSSTAMAKQPLKTIKSTIHSVSMETVHVSMD